MTSRLAVRDDPSRYQLVASAVAGRPVAVAITNVGEDPFTDGETVYLGAHHDRDAHLVELAVQASLIAAGSLRREIIRRLVGRPNAARRYLALEGRRAIEALRETMPGLAGRTDHLREGPGLTSSADDSLRLALGRGRLPDPPPAFGSLRPHRVLEALARAEGRAATSSGPAIRLPQAEDGVELRLEENPMEGRFLRLLRKLLDLGGEEQEKRAASRKGGGQLVANPGTGARPGSRLLIWMTPPRTPDEGLPDELGDHVYPEWDVTRQRYRPRWCTVFERDPPPEALRPLDRPPRDDALRRRLSPLGVGLERRRRQLQGDDLDIDAVVDSRVQLMARTTPDENVYIESQRRRRDLGVLVLLDVSGSTGDPSPYGGTIHERQRVAAAQLLDTLNVLGDRVAAYAFRSRGRRAVELTRVKTFAEPLDGLVFERLGGLAPNAFTRMGAAIRHATHVVETRAGTSGRLLVVLSDGLAYDDGYERAYGEADARRALAEARERGVGCLCLSIGGGSDTAALRRVFGTSAHAAAPRLEDLGDVIGPLFRRALLSAETRRRQAQRERRAGDDAERQRPPSPRRRRASRDA